MMLSSFSLGMVMSESTYCDSSLIPSSASIIRFLPSKTNGLVTTATVRMPSPLATSATIGAAPVPVPPPIPAVIKTISAPCKTSAMRSLSSKAASLPMPGFAPAPRPLVMFPPSCNSVLELRLWSAWESVLAQINSTP